MTKSSKVPTTPILGPVMPRGLVGGIFTKVPWQGGGFKYFLFSPLLGKISILTNIFQMVWNHQLVDISTIFGASRKPINCFQGGCLKWGANHASIELPSQQIFPAFLLEGESPKILQHSSSWMVMSSPYCFMIFSGDDRQTRSRQCNLANQEDRLCIHRYPTIYHEPPKPWKMKVLNLQYMGYNP